MTMTLYASLSGEALDLVRRHEKVLDRLPRTFLINTLAEMTRWPVFFEPEKRYFHALFDELASLDESQFQAMFGSLAGFESQAGLRSLNGRDPDALRARSLGKLQRQGQYSQWRREIDAIFETLEPRVEARLYTGNLPARLVVILYGEGIAIRRNELWKRFREVGRRVPLDPGRAGSSDAFLRALFTGREAGDSANLFEAVRQATARSGGYSPLDAWVIEAGDGLHRLCEARSVASPNAAAPDVASRGVASRDVASRDLAPRNVAPRNVATRDVAFRGGLLSPLPGGEGQGVRGHQPAPIGEPAATRPCATGMSYDRLRGYRERLTDLIHAKVVEGLRSPLELSAYVKTLEIAPPAAKPGAPPEGLTLYSDRVLLAFVRDTFLAGNGTLIINNTFVEWAAVQALKRAQPRLLVARFGVRDKMKPFSSLLLFSKPRPTDQIPIMQDPLGSFIDAELLAYYIWLNAEKGPPYKDRTLYLMLAEDVDEMLVIAPPSAAAAATLGAPSPGATRPPAAGSIPATPTLPDVAVTMAKWLDAELPGSPGQPIPL